MNQLDPILSVQLTQIDCNVIHSGALDNTPLPRSPVIRVFGKASTGASCCLHLHQIYPYFYVEYAEDMDPDHAKRYISRLTRALDHAIAISLKRDPAAPTSRFVHSAVLVKGVHFYGYHHSYSPFLKIHIVEPTLVSRAVTILQSGTVMATRFRTFESHISYILQFLCDFGLYGCGWIDLSEAMLRGADDASPSTSFQASPYFRQTRMKMEFDSAAPHILNRRQLSARDIHHKLKIPADSIPSEPFVQSVRELWDDERKRRAAASLPATPPTPLDPSRNSRGEGGGWAAEARYWDEIRTRIQAESDHDYQPKDATWSRWLMTTFESVEAVWPDEYKTWRPISDDVQGGLNSFANPYEAVAGTSQRLAPDSDKLAGQDVDESMLSSQEMSLLIEQEEAEYDRALVPLDVADGEGEEDADEFADDYTPAPPTQPQGTTPRSSGMAGTPRTPRKRDDVSPRRTAISTRTRERTGRFTEAFHKVAGPGFHGSPSVADGYPSPLRNPNASDEEATPKAYTQSGRIASTSHDLPDTAEVHDENVSLWKALSSAHKEKALQSASADNPDESTFLLNDSISNGSNLAKDSRRPRKRMRFNEDSVIIEAPSFLSNRSEALVRRIRNTARPQASLALAKQPLTNSYTYALPPPSSTELITSMAAYGVPEKIYRDPHYSKGEDASERSWEFAGLTYHLKGDDGLDTLDEWTDSGKASHEEDDPFRSFLDDDGVSGWEYALSPPSSRETTRWLAKHRLRPSLAKPLPARSQIDGPTLHAFGLKHTPNVNPEKSIRDKQPMTVFALEVFAPSRELFVPNPEVDRVAAVFWSYQSDTSTEPSSYRKGAFWVSVGPAPPDRLGDSYLTSVSDELELVNSVIDLVLDLDPDMVVGWEIQSASWGYLGARAQSYGFDLGEQISRGPGRVRTVGTDQWGERKTSTFRVVGRHVLNVWRIMRSELTLTSYTFENAAFHLLQRRVPKYKPSVLTEWYTSEIPSHSAQLARYLSTRTAMVLEMLDAAEVVTKTAEFARVFGVDFFSVLSRGSQFKVESFMFRIAKPESFVLLTPSKRDVGNQNAAECMPLIMEPLSALYNSPLVVLDFQSLYPSVMIAYNYCYSTCLGRPARFKGQYKLGVAEVKQPEGLLSLLEEHITVAPNGIMYVRDHVRKGLLGRMLTELLDTRVMVKQSMKTWKTDKALQRVLNARQLGLKVYIANVTYGYTSASFSGRMPLVEIADSIVQTGRETLEKAIELIEDTTEWGARVVYGDTDSLFVYLPNKTKEQAFRLGYEIAEAVTKRNPVPIKLKFEKVYLPCVLMAKKRYVGFMWETPDVQEPTFDAKGIETVRRDGVPAQQKMVETTLKMLFRSQDLSEIKAYCQRSWEKILENKVSIQDLTFAREVRLGTYSDKVPPPPGAAVAALRMALDPYNEPQYGERVPYVIARGETGSRLVDRAVAPEDMLDSKTSQIDGMYYISRVLIPPLARILNLVGADVKGWFFDVPRRARAEDAEQAGALTSPDKQDLSNSQDPEPPQMEAHQPLSRCAVCGDANIDEGICEDCLSDPAVPIADALSRRRSVDERLKAVTSVCVACAQLSSTTERVPCVSLDCAWLFERTKAEKLWQEVCIFEQQMEELGLPLRA